MSDITKTAEFAYIEMGVMQNKRTNAWCAYIKLSDGNTFKGDFRMTEPEAEADAVSLASFLQACKGDDAQLIQVSTLKIQSNGTQVH